MKILGWYSLVVLTFSIMANIANDKSSSTVRLGTVITTIPIVFYIALNLFR
jgi:hypothetical protein